MAHRILDGRLKLRQLPLVQADLAGEIDLSVGRLTGRPHRSR